MKNVTKLWGGYVGGKLDIRAMDTGFGGFGRDGKRFVAAIFTTKKAAREQYQDVRPVEIQDQATKQ